MQEQYCWMHIHRCMHPSEFNDIYLKDLLENLSHENKAIVIMGDFNIDLLKYDTEKDSEDFLDSMYASFLLPYISTPSQVTPSLKPLLIMSFLIISKTAVYQRILQQQSLIATLSSFYCKI